MSPHHHAAARIAPAQPRAAPSNDGLPDPVLLAHQIGVRCAELQRQIRKLGGNSPEGQALADLLGWQRDWRMLQDVLVLLAAYHTSHEKLRVFAGLVKERAREIDALDLNVLDRIRALHRRALVVFEDLARDVHARRVSLRSTGVDDGQSEDARSTRPPRSYRGP